MVSFCKKSGCRVPRRSDIDLSWDDPSAFVRSQFCGVWLGIVWHGVWCLYFTTTFFLDILYYTSPGWRVYWYIYFRNWVYTMTVIVSATEMVIRITVFIKFKTVLTGEATAMVWILKIQWIVHNIHNVIALISTVFHLSLIPFDDGHTNVNKILLTTVYVITSLLFVSKVPIKILHFYQPTLFVIIYAIFSGLYQELNNSVHQKFILDWTNSTKSAVVLVFMVGLAPLFFQCIFFGLYKIRTKVSSRCSKKDIERGMADRIHRDITTTDVVLEDNSASEFVDVNLNIRDDFDVKTNAQPNGDVFRRYNTRLFKSESDLQDYRLMNGFYCDFAKCSRILHHTHTAGDVFYNTNIDRDIETPPSDSKGSQIIVVKGCVTNESGDAIDDDIFSEQLEDIVSTDVTSQS